MHRARYVGRAGSFHAFWVLLPQHLHLFCSSFRTLSPPWMISAFWCLSLWPRHLQRPHPPLPYHPVITRSYTTVEISNLNPLFSSWLAQVSSLPVFHCSWALSSSLPSLTELYPTIHLYNITPFLSLTQSYFEKLQFWINHNIHLLFACTRAARCSWRNHSIRLSGFILKSWFQTSEWPSIPLSNPITCP